jgi:hypothetical protein
MLRNVCPWNNPIAAHEERLGQHLKRIHLHHSDYQFCKMLFVQIIVYIIFTISYPIPTIYNAIILSIGTSQSEEGAAIVSLPLFITSTFLINFYNAASFFVFLTSSTFRTELRKIIILVVYRYFRK